MKPMNAKDIFGIVVRVCGLGCLGYGLRYVACWLYVGVKHNAPEGWSEFDYFLAGVIYLALGVFLLRGSHHVVGFAYPRERDEGTETKKDHDVV
jgi:hypothetical protein